MDLRSNISMTLAREKHLAERKGRSRLSNIRWNSRVRARHLVVSFLATLRDVIMKVLHNFAQIVSALIRLSRARARYDKRPRAQSPTK